MKYIKKDTITPLALTLWVCIIGIFLLWQEMETRKEEKLLANSTASGFFHEILISRLWNASHGGVYVPITPTTQPNKYLPLKNRDLIADNGLHLTKVNPSYMTRQLSEIAGRNKNGIQFHITSLKPIRPENKPTDWETKWLKTFEQGAKEQGEFFKVGNVTWFRYMAPLITEIDCLKCHAQQGYKEGDIRGGISVSLPYPANSRTSLYVSSGAVAFFGLLLIFTGGTLYEKKKRLFNATFNSTIPTCVTDKNFTILMANKSYWSEFGPLSDHKPSIKCYEHRPSQACHTESCLLTRIMNGSSKEIIETNRETAGGSRCFLVTARPLLDDKNNPIGVIESFQDITSRKRVERDLEESNRQLEVQSTTDSLTGIANRRYFDQVLTKERARHARSGKELSLILLDIDLFKRYNDCYGHVKGDECLRQVAQIIAECATRPADLAARYGGEEFACILPETDSMGAIAIAERIRKNIIACAIPHQDSNIADFVTASIGVITDRCSADDSCSDIVAKADKLLYQAKAAGRNRIECDGYNKAEGVNNEHLVQLTWKDSFCCGNSVIDQQHKSLFHLANELLDKVLSGHPSPEIFAAMSSLLDEVKQHFHEEEEILKAIRFPGTSHHIAEHARLLERGMKLTQDFENSTLSVGDVFQFLVNKVVMLHILGTDREYFPFTKAAEQAETEG
ncbi:MAG: diguanylate cyclase [Desulfobulbaceae bacterium]|nr:diguanylate cyclase [Desulfobulbaceae bacterium]